MSITIQPTRRLGHRCAFGGCRTGARFTVKGSPMSDFDPIRLTVFRCPRHVADEVRIRIDAWLKQVAERDPRSTRRGLEALTRARPHRSEVTGQPTGLIEIPACAFPRTCDEIGGTCTRAGCPFGPAATLDALHAKDVNDPKEEA